MTTRRGYHKVRGGCLTCKQRKVRCSLERPICYNCSRLSRSCSYAEKPALQGPASNASTPSESSGCQPNHALEIELMHQYTAFTCLLLSNDPVLIRLWRDVVPQIAFKHPFLMQGIFAVAAQHKLHEMSGATAELVEAATYYHQEALSTYIHLLNNITEETCHALFVFSQLIVGLSYSHLILESGSGQALIVGIIEIFELLKGALAIAEKASAWLNAGELEPMMGDFPGVEPLSIPASGNPCTEALAALSEHIAAETDQHGSMIARREILHSTMELIHALLLSPNDSNDRLNRIIGLPVWLDADFGRLLRTGDQAALILLGFYGAALDRIQDVWFFRGVGGALVRAVSATLDSDWAPHLAWPLLQIKGRDDNETTSMSNHIKADPNIIGFPDSPSENEYDNPPGFDNEGKNQIYWDQMDDYEKTLLRVFYNVAMCEKFPSWWWEKRKEQWRMLELEDVLCRASDSWKNGRINRWLRELNEGKDSSFFNIMYEEPREPLDLLTMIGPVSPSQSEQVVVRESEWPSSSESGDESDKE